MGTQGWRQPPLSPGIEHEERPTEDQHPRGGVKQPIGSSVGAQSLQSRDRIVPRAADHVMPLQKLMDDDPVDEPTQAEAKDERRRSGYVRSPAGPRGSAHYETPILVRCCPVWPRKAGRGSMDPVGVPSRLCSAPWDVHVATWSGTVYVAFVLAAYSRRILGWRAGPRDEDGLVLDALEVARWTGGREGAAGHCLPLRPQWLVAPREGCRSGAIRRSATRQVAKE